MSASTFDTFNAARALEAAGVERDQAEAIAGAIAAQALTRVDLEPLATKADLTAVRSELATIRWTIGLLAAFIFAIGLRVFGLV